MIKSYFYERVFNDSPAGSDHNTYDASDPSVWGKLIDLGQITSGSAHIFWSGLTGILNGQVLLLTSNHPNPSPTDWVPKRQAYLNITTADGHDMISLSGITSERWYNLRFLHNGVTGGFINCWLNGK